MPKAKTDGAGFLSKSETAKLKRLYRDGKATYINSKSTKGKWFIQKEVAYFLHNEDSYTKYRLATQHFKRLPAFAKRINEIGCLDQAFMDKLWDSNKGVKYLLVCVDVLSRFVCAQIMKSKYSTDAVGALKKCCVKRLCQRKFGLIREYSLVVSFESFVRTRKSKFTLLEVKEKLL